jgi:FtsH-binding integral membrane protein
LPRDSDDGVEETRPSRLHVWTVWASLMALTGIATACLLDLVSPLFPSGDWHWLISALFVVVVWPALMWSLRPLLKRHLPA